MTSRSVRDSRYVPRPDLDPVGFVDQIAELIRHGKHDMLIPADDQALMAVTAHYQVLKDLLHIACPPPEITNLVLDKVPSLDVAEKCGIPIPKTKLISNSAELSKLISSVPFPWILKPARKELTEEVKTLTIASADDIVRKFPTARDFAPPMLLQEYCSGAGVGVEMLLHDGQCVAIFQHRRLEEVPYTGGFSVTAVAEQPDSDLAEKSLLLLRALHWEGPAMVEFKVNPRDGSAVFMEVNGRYWGTISLPTSAGIDFPLYHWQLVHGEVPSVPAEYAAGRKWRWTAGHLWRLNGLLLASRRSSAARKELIHSLLNLPWALGASAHDSLFTPSDPMPAILEMLEMIRFHSWDDIKTLFRHFSRHS